MSLETMTRKEKNILSSNVKEHIPLKILDNKARILQMEMRLISSTPIRNSEMQSKVNESYQLGSPIARVNFTDISQINENKSKEIVPSNANFGVKSESKNVNNPKNVPYHHMILYSSDEDAKVISRKKFQKKTIRKRKNVSFGEDTDSEIISKYSKNNVDFVENNDIDKVDKVQENCEHEKLVNSGVTNTNKRGATEIYDRIEVSNKKSNENNNINKKVKRKYTRNTKTNDIINVQNTEVESEAVISEEVVDIPILETNETKNSFKKFSKNKKNKETNNKVVKAKISVTEALDKALQLHLSDNEIDRLENKKKPKLESNKNVIVEIVLKDKDANKQSPEKCSNRKTKPGNVEQNLRSNYNDQNDEVNEIFQESVNGVRKSSRQRMPSQAYWIAKSNSRSSDYADTIDLPEHTKDNNTKEQFSKNTRYNPVSSKTKIAKTKQHKQTKEVIAMSTKPKTIKADLNSNNSSTDPYNLYSHDAHNREGHRSNKATQNPNSDVNSCNNGVQREVNTVHEKEKDTKSTPVKQNKKSMPSHPSPPKKQKNSSFKQPESNNLNTSPTDTDVNSDNIPSDTLTNDFHENKTSKSANNNAEHHNKESIIDNYSFKEIALAQRHLTEIENSKQPEYFGKFPQTYHTHSYNPNLSIGINISYPNFISGVLEIVPSGRKQQEYPKKNNMSFFILEGYAEVCVGNISKILRIGDSFFVPNNTPYYIINLNKTKRLLMLFTKHTAL